MASNTGSIGQFIETKLTKGEAIDLLIVGLKEELNKGIRELEKKLERLAKEFSFGDVRDAIPPGTRVRLSSGYRDHDQFRIEFVAMDDSIPYFRPAAFPSHIQAVLEERARINTELGRMRSQLNKLEDKKGDARSMIMATMLESTPEGKQFLQLIGDLRLRVQPKLALAAKNSF